MIRKCLPALAGGMDWCEGKHGSMITTKHMRGMGKDTTRCLAVGGTGNVKKKDLVPRRICLAITDGAYITGLRRTVNWLGSWYY